MINYISLRCQSVRLGGFGAIRFSPDVGALGLFLYLNGIKTPLHPRQTIYNVYTVYKVYIIYTVYTFYTVYIVFYYFITIFALPNYANTI